MVITSRINMKDRETVVALYAIILVGGYYILTNIDYVFRLVVALLDALGLGINGA